MERIINKGTLVDEWACDIDKIELGICDWQDGDKTFNYLAIGLSFYEEGSSIYIIHLYELDYCELDLSIKYHLKKILTSGHNIKDIINDLKANNWLDRHVYNETPNHVDFLHNFVYHECVKHSNLNFTTNDIVSMVTTINNAHNPFNKKHKVGKKQYIPKIAYLNYEDEEFWKILNNSYVMY